MMSKKSLGLLLMIFSFACTSVFAQQKTEPYTLGETLTYEAKYSKAILRGVPAADLSFVVARSANGQDFLIKSEAKSKGTLVKLFYKFNQNIQSTVDGTMFSIKRTVKRDEQGDRIRESEALFDYRDRKVIYIETDPKDAARAPRQVASPIEANTQDLVTGIYAIRRLPLAVGKTFELSVSDSGLVYKIPMRVTAREQQKSILGKVWCFRVEPEVFGANRLIENKGSMILWITDDARRLPVRSQINASIGRVEVRLKKLEIIK
jgi:hypothetical protein